MVVESKCQRPSSAFRSLARLHRSQDFKAFREEDLLPELVLNQIFVGVSTRNCESSLDKPAAKLSGLVA